MGVRGHHERNGLTSVSPVNQKIAVRREDDRFFPYRFRCVRFEDKSVGSPSFSMTRSSIRLQRESACVTDRASLSRIMVDLGVLRAFAAFAISANKFRCESPAGFSEPAFLLDRAD